MSWYIVYRGKTSIGGGIFDILDKAGITYYLPKRTIEYYEDNRMNIREEEVLRNLIFIKTDDDIFTLIKYTDGLRTPYIDKASGKPATISDMEMQRFIHFLELQNTDIKVMHDSISRFRVCQKVRVKAGDYEGIEGYVFRIRGDRKLIISLGEMALAISGIHHTLLEPVAE